MSNFLKKNMKTLVFIFALAIVLSYTMVKAYSSPATVQIMRHNVTNSYVNGTTYTKNTTNSQSVKLTDVFTALTNPCNNCKIGVKLYDASSNSLVGQILQLYRNTNGTFNYSYFTGDYYLSIARLDATLLSTYVYGTWYLNQAM